MQEVVDELEALRQSEAMYRSLLEELPAAWAYHRIVTDAAGVPVDYIFLEVNRAFEEYTGIRRAQVLGRGVREVIPGVEHQEPDLIALYGEVALTGAERSFEIYFAPLKRWYRIKATCPRRGYFVALFSDITPNKMVEQSVQRTAEALARSNQELEQFAYVASHDLQEPLRMVASFMQLLQRRYQGQLDADADDYIAFAVDGATRMKQLIDDLLVYSRISSLGKEAQPHDSGEALRQAVGNLSVAIEERHAEIVVGELPVVPVDQGQLVQLFQNLLQNAIKFTGEARPRIEIRAVRCDGEHEFTVRDNGIGIEAGYFDRIFAIFQRLHGKEVYGGTGIGLAICKRIVERHGGRIWVESVPKEGSTFHFTLPDR